MSASYPNNHDHRRLSEDLASQPMSPSLAVPLSVNQNTAHPGPDDLGRKSRQMVPIKAGSESSHATGEEADAA
jgi:hypothetical protein